MSDIQALDSGNIAHVKQLIVASLAEIGYVPDDYADGDLRDLLNSYNDGLDTFLVSQEGSQVAGVLAFKDRGGGTGEIKRFCVDVQFRKNDFEEQLLLHLLQYVQSEKFEAIFALVPRPTSWLIDFLKTHQFIEDDAASTETDVFLERRLK